MRKYAVLLAAIGLAVAACGGGDAEACGEIADDAVALMQDLITDAEGLVETGGDADQLDAILTTFESGIDGLEERQSDEGCSDSQIEDLLAERADSLQANTEVGQQFVQEFVDQLESGSFFE